jgi:hypothetical protein
MTSATEEAADRGGQPACSRPSPHKLQRDQQTVSALTEQVQALEAHLVEAEEERRWT